MYTHTIKMSCFMLVPLFLLLWLVQISWRNLRWSHTAVVWRLFKSLRWTSPGVYDIIPSGCDVIIPEQVCASQVANVMRKTRWQDGPESTAARHHETSRCFTSSRGDYVMTSASSDRNSANRDQAAVIAWLRPHKKSSAYGWYTA